MYFNNNRIRDETIEARIPMAEIKITATKHNMCINYTQKQKTV